MNATRFASRFAAILVIALGSTQLVLSQEATDHSKMDHSNMDHGTTDAAPSTEAYKTGMNRMMSDMMIPYTGNADVDFVRGMIPHHQGAIDMAKVVLQFGKDPEIRKLAEGIIKAQESEIAFMQEWLKNNPVK